MEQNVLYGSVEDDLGLQEVGQNIDLESNPVSEEIKEYSGKVVKVTKKRTKFTCLICTRKFKQHAGRYNHMKKVHNIYPTEKANVKCLEEGCLFTCSYKEKLQFHLSSVHEIDMDITIKTFECMQDFLRWKDEYERQEKSRFVKKSGSRVREEGIRVAYYYCSRSGNYVSHSKGIKKTKKKGTSKTNNHCTASITSIELPEGKVEVKICSTHYGHDSELQHLRLTQTEKFQIAEQLTRGVPRDLVLDNVRSSAGSDVDRIHLITIKDVKNIEKAYGIQSCPNEHTGNIFYNLNRWITSIMQTEHCPVLYFREEGVFNTKSHDVTLILLTPGQLEVLNKYASEGIFYVTTYAAKNKQTNFSQNQNVKPPFIFTTTLMLVDDLNEAVAVSFMVSNKINAEKYKLFFQSVQKRMPKISATAVLTDDQEEIFEIWCSVFKEVPQYLWSNRFVDGDWRDNLISISDEDLQVSIYENLYPYLESSDKIKLETTLKNYVNQLQTDVTTKKFGDYFASKYIGSERMWAGCYGKALVAVNAQLNMELVCNDIEEVNHRKHWGKKFMVRIVQHLLKLVSDKQCLRQSKLQRQVQELPTHHRLALNITSESISQESDICWRVDSVKDPKNIFAFVNMKKDPCTSMCALICSKCGACAHQFRCSCRVYAYDRTMCKHIHAVALNNFPKLEPTPELAMGQEESSENSQTDVQRDISNRDLLLVKEEVWRQTKEATMSKRRLNNAENPTTTEDNLLPVIQNVLQNKHTSAKRKVGRPRTRIHCSEFSPDSPFVSSSKKRKKTKKVLEQITITNDDKESTSSINLRPRRINILRKSYKK